MRTVKFDQMTLYSDGSIGLKFNKFIVDGDMTISVEPLRTMIDTLTSADVQVKAVDDYLIAIGWPKTPDDTVSRINAIRKLHDKSPDVIENRARITAEREATIAAVAKEPPATISDRQFYVALSRPPYSLITEEEMLLVLQKGELPAAVKEIIMKLPEDQRVHATTYLIAATEFHFTHPLVSQFSTLAGWTEEQTVEFFKIAATL